MYDIQFICLSNLITLEEYSALVAARSTGGNHCT